MEHQIILVHLKKYLGDNCIYFDDVYFPDRIIQTKVPLPDINFALCRTPFGMNIVVGDVTLYFSSPS
jgi:hypothetical protein